MKVLIVFEQTNDRRIKAVVEMTEIEYEFFKDANEYFINYNEYDARKIRTVNSISVALSKRPTAKYKLSWLSEYERQWLGKFSDSVIDSVSDIKAVDHLIHCGWGCT